MSDAPVAPITPKTPKRAKSLKGRQRRAIWLAAGVAVLAVAAVLVVQALRENVVFMYTPSDIASGKPPKDRPFRVGGLVSQGSVVREANTINVAFKITDGAQTIPVTYTGNLPDLFKECKGAVVQGIMQKDGSFKAREVLAKHDENYRAPEVEEALKRAGHLNKKPDGC
jgi:cytochrome c-type biogenesis protein CcmE